MNWQPVPKNWIPPVYGNIRPDYERVLFLFIEYIKDSLLFFISISFLYHSVIDESSAVWFPPFLMFTFEWVNVFIFHLISSSLKFIYMWVYNLYTYMMLSVYWSVLVGIMFIILNYRYIQMVYLFLYRNESPTYY